MSNSTFAKIGLLLYLIKLRPATEKWSSAHFYVSPCQPAQHNVFKKDNSPSVLLVQSREVGCLPVLRRLHRVVAVGGVVVGVEGTVVWLLLLLLEAEAVAVAAGGDGRGGAAAAAGGGSVLVGKMRALKNKPK